MKNRIVKCKVCKNLYKRSNVNKIQNALVCGKCQPSIFDVYKTVEKVNN